MEQKLKSVDWYLQWAIPIPAYVNTSEEEDLVTKFSALYSIALGAKENNELCNSKNIAKWRKAYDGTLGALTKDGKISDKHSRQLRKVVYEFVESKVDNNIPLPKMSPKYKSDLPLVQVTEDYLKYNIDCIFTKYLNDRSERSTYVDGTSWYKIWWDSLDSSNESSGQVKVDICLADQIIPQPGITDWRKLEYIFEKEQVTLKRIWDLTGRRITPVASDTSELSNPTSNTVDNSSITMITCYYLNDKRIVGRFAWAEHTRQVIFNDEDWQIRKLRTCTKCGQVVPQAKVCPVCGSKSFKYKIPEKDVLDEDLYVIYNPYEAGETTDPNERDHYQQKLFLSKGTEIPFYHVRMLPFVPRPAISSIGSLYGMSEAAMILEMQDMINKMYTKMSDKTLSSSAIVTKPARLNIKNTDEGIKVVDVRTAEEAAMVQLKQIMADTSQDIVAANMVYESAKASSGVTDSYQGKYDASATSGKAKEFAAMQTAGRIESLRIMKAAAFSGVYEVVLKYLLAFSDEPRKFAKVLPDGSVTEEEWNKYMFLDKTPDGSIFYRDDFQFSSDPAATLETNRVAMWQEIQSQFIQGCMGTPTDPRTLELFWNMMNEYQYPLAKLVLAGIKENAQHLPQEIEQLLLQQPEILKQVLQTMQQAGLMNGGETRGGARENSGPEGNGATHAANVQRTNARNRAAEQQVTEGLGSTQTGGAVS